MPADKEKLKVFQNGLAQLRRKGRTYYTRGQSAAFGQGLEDLLESLRDACPDPRQGVTLVARFFEHDRDAFNKCDDSDGNVGDVFRGKACEVFAQYARACDDKEFVAQTMMTLVADDGNGVRDHLLKYARDVLPEGNIRRMIDELWAKGLASHDQPVRDELRLVEVLARQSKDAPLFEKARRLSWKNLNAAACCDIAEVYWESGDPTAALAWLQRVEPDEPGPWTTPMLEGIEGG
jgi:hypothetical protein